MKDIAKKIDYISKGIHYYAVKTFPFLFTNEIEPYEIEELNDSKGFSHFIATKPNIKIAKVISIIEGES